MTDYLTEILSRKEKEVQTLVQPVTFKEALSQPSLAVIAEIKRKSPSKGVLNAEIDPLALAKKYVAGGAAAISVLTDEVGFGGSLDDLKAVVAACPATPVLRKDFIIDERQLYETARSGAHAVLLIAAALKERLAKFIHLANRYGLETLVEVHTLDELRLAQAAGAEIIGVNSRSLATFEVSLKTAEMLASHFAPHTVKVAESGIGNAEDAARMRKVGFDAVLVGEALVRAKDPEKLIQEMRHAR